MHLETPSSVPRFVNALTDTDAYEGGHVRFRCVVSAVPRPILEFYKDGALLPVTASDKHTFSFESDGVVTLSVTKLTEEDSGTYLVVASNDVGQAKTSAVLTVIGTYTYFYLFLHHSILLLDEMNFYLNFSFSEEFEGEFCRDNYLYIKKKQ